MRLRWTPVTGYKDGVTLSPVTGTVKSIEIVFDEGQDLGADSAGLAVLDNIDVNRTLVGSHEAQKDNADENKDKDQDNGKHKDKGHENVKEDSDDQGA